MNVTVDSLMIFHAQSTAEKSETELIAGILSKDQKHTKG